MNEPQRLFFVHVMKTGGATFRRQIEAQLGARAVYPDPELDTDLLTANYMVAYLLGLSPTRTSAIRAFTGHFPFVVTDLLGGGFLTLTILREPVERTISYLKHCRRYEERHRERPLEAIYEDPWSYPMLIHNHQVKTFAMTPEDQPETIMDIIDVDERRYRVATENLERVDVLGLHDRYGEFVDAASARLGWHTAPVPNWHVSEPSDVSRTFRRRIADDNAIDIEFYECATQLYVRG